MLTIMAFMYNILISYCLYILVLEIKTDFISIQHSITGI